MYCNFTKSHAFPLAFRVSSQPSKCFKPPLSTLNPQSSHIGSHPGILKDPFTMSVRCLSKGFCKKTHKTIYYLSPKITSIGNCHETLGARGGYVAKSTKFSSGFRLKQTLQSYPLMKARGYSSTYSQKGVEDQASVVSGGKTTLPWLSKHIAKEDKNSDDSVKNTRSSWEKSAEKYLKRATPVEEGRETRRYENRRNDYRENVHSVEEEEEGDFEEVNDTRWDKIKTQFNKTLDTKPNSGRPEVRRWDKQENWGRKTYKEATESTLPKIVGEGIYGVGPVLAALSASRREFYALYIQEGLDLSGNNKKKKDKKGFERVLKIAEKLGLTKKAVSKHDLNMITDNRPHQGLVLDASPLEMVNIKELEPIIIDGEKAPLWVALDEVTDPQNLGAIIRSAYFFGASGVILCAKNSAPLSGVVSKASAGSLELTELRSCKNMMQFLVSSAGNGWRVLGGSVCSKAVSLNEVASGEPTILVLGSEGKGLRPLVERSCTQLIKIPGNVVGNVGPGSDDVENEEFRSFMAIESLNVSVAAGVLLHHLIGRDE